MKIEKKKNRLYPGTGRAMALSGAEGVRSTFHSVQPHTCFKDLMLLCMVKKECFEKYNMFYLCQKQVSSNLWDVTLKA